MQDNECGIILLVSIGIGIGAIPHDPTLCNYLCLEAGTDTMFLSILFSIQPKRQLHTYSWIFLQVGAVIVRILRQLGKSWRKQ